MEGRKSFLLRVSAPLWRDVEQWAQEEFRSVNAQVEYILRQAVLRRKGAGSEPAPPLPPPTASGNAAPEPSPTPQFPGSDLEVGRQD